MSKTRNSLLRASASALPLLALASLACRALAPSTPTPAATSRPPVSPAAPTASPAPPLEVTGNVVKGPVAVALVDFYALNPDGSRGRLLGSTMTDAKGAYTVNLDPAPTGPFLAVASGGVYVDEWTGITTPFDPNDVLTAALPAGTQRATVNPVTHIAATRALVLAGQGVDLATAVDAVNASVAGIYQIPSTYGVIPAPATNGDELSLATWIERTYGIILGGMAQLASSLNVRAIDLGMALADDLSDGVFDGMRGDQVIRVPTIGGGTIPLPPHAGTWDLQKAIDLFVVSDVNRTNLTHVQISADPAPVGIGLNTAGRFYVNSTVLPAWTENQFGSAQLDASGGVPPYFCALSSGALPAGILLNGCVLSGTPPVLAGGSTMSISTPFTVTISDSASPPASADVGLHVTILRAGPTVIPIEGFCVVNALCKTLVAAAEGGTPPYYFTHGTFASSPPPLGTAILTSGELSGTIKTEGTFEFRVCAVDLVGASNCGSTWVTVVKESPLSRFDGTYTGSYSGSHPYGTETGSVTLTVADGILTGTATGAITSVEGSVDASGAAVLTVYGECPGSATGTFAVSDAGGSVGGTFFCTASGYGVDLSGTWNATR